MATNNQISDHISEQRQAVTALIESIDKLRALLAEWNALGLDAAAIDAAQAAAGDGLGNSGITGAQVTAVYTTLGALESLLAAGHATNLYGVKL